MFPSPVFLNNKLFNFKFQFLTKETYFSFSFFFPHPSSCFNSLSTQGTERGIQNFWQKQEWLHWSKGAALCDHHPRTAFDRWRIPRILEWSWSEWRWKTGLQRIHQDHATVLNLPCPVCFWMTNRLWVPLKLPVGM